MGALCAGKANNPAALERVNIEGLKANKAAKSVSFAEPIIQAPSPSKPKAASPAKIQAVAEQQSSGTSSSDEEKVLKAKPAAPASGSG